MTYGKRRRSSFIREHAIYYRMDGSDEVVVFRVLDCRRDPRRVRVELE